MPLSPEQYQQLLDLTRRNHPNYKIAWWLMDLGLSFKESSELRHQALGECFPTRYEEKKSENLGDFTSAKDWVEENKAPFIEEETPLPLGENIQEEKEACISCGSEDFSCSCDPKRLSDIPF